MMPYLAQYTVRSKQQYIFRTNRLKEVVGASELIRDTFQDLFSCAKTAGLEQLIRDDDPGSPFCMAAVMEKFQEGKLDAVELFCGGGNDTVLFRDRETFLRANRAYTRYVLEHAPGMIPLCAGVETAGENYKEDYSRLMQEVDRRKNAMQSGRAENSQPLAKQDRTTLQAIGAELRHGQGSEQTVEYLSAEAAAKRRKSENSEKIETDTSLLDQLAKDGSRSLLAIVHADGNRMGVKIQNRLGEKTDYDTCVNGMRAFSREINEVFTVKGKAALEKRLEELRAAHPEDPEKNLLVRWVVTDGDDVTFLCNAKYALELTKAYLEGVAGVDKAYSSCAGICVFHGHYPFSRAYELAEQACDNAKRVVHASGLEQAWLDFHNLRSGVNGDLEDIRERHRTKGCMARPWFVCGEEPPEPARSLTQLEALKELLRGKKVKRGQIKTVGTELEVSPEAGELVWKRLCYNNKGLGEKALALFKESRALYSALYDLSEFYDLWFRKGGDDIE